MIRVYEDSGGGLHMTDGKTYASGMEHQEQPGGLINDIISYDDWQSDASDHGNYSEIEGTVDHETTIPIATYHPVIREIVLHTDHMGCAGLRYAGIDPDMR